MSTHNRRESSHSNPTPDTADDRAVVMSAWTRLHRLLGEKDRDNPLRPLEPALRRYDLGIFRLVIMGEIKKGKSSFLNALLGEEKLLPTDSDVATSTVYKVMYGPQRKFKVFFLPDVDTEKRPEVLEIDESQLAEYGTENGNPNNEKRVDFIGVELPHPLLRQGLVLVDTPGIGGLHRAHRRISRQYAPSADAVFFVLDSVEAVISADEIAFLQDLYSHVTKRIFFIQTKTDLADMQQVEAWQERNKQVLTEKLGIPTDRLYYFPVSSKLKQIADRRHDGNRLNQSGFLTVLDFLHRGLMAAKDRQVSADFARQLGKICNDQVRDIQERIAICRQQSQEELKRLQQDYQVVRDELEQWRRTVYPVEIQKFADRFADLRRRKQAEIQDLLDPGAPMVLDVIERLRQSGKSPKELTDLAPNVQHDWVAAAADAVGRVQQEFNEEFSVLLRETSQAMVAHFGGEPATRLMVRQHDLDTNDLTHTESVAAQLGVFEQSRSALYGGMVGKTIALIGVGLASVIFPPVAAVGVMAALAGGVAGAVWGHAELVTRKREEVLMKLQSALQNQARRCGRQFLNKFVEIAEDYERHARDVFKSAVDQAEDTVRQRLKQLEQVLAQTREQSQTEAEILQKKLEELTTIERQLRAVAARAS